MKTGSIKEKKEAVQVWGQIGRNPSTGDFINKDTFEQMKPYIQEWKSNNSPQSEMQIQSYLSMRLMPSLTEKKQREDRLLWKKN